MSGMTGHPFSNEQPRRFVTDSYHPGLSYWGWSTGFQTAWNNRDSDSDHLLGRVGGVSQASARYRNDVDG